MTLFILLMLAIGSGVLIAKKPYSLSRTMALPWIALMASGTVVFLGATFVDSRLGWEIVGKHLDMNTWGWWNFALQDVFMGIIILGIPLCLLSTICGVSMFLFKKLMSRKSVE